MAGKGMQIRGGTRGGQDQFDWEDVKVDKHRENYLGHSLNASVGRWQKGKDLTWYTKNSKVAGQKERLKAEVAAIKRAEEEAMAAALGLKPPAPVKPQQALTQQELTEVCRRRSKDEIEGGEEERIKGIGYQSRRSQAMFMGSKSTTTKEGATIFEHDSLLKDDGRLRMPESKRRSVSDVTSPTLEGPTETPQRKPVLAIPTLATPGPTVVAPSLDPVPEDKKAKKKKKKPKKHKEKAKAHHREESSDSFSDSGAVKKAKKVRKRKKEKRDSSCSSSSSEEEWAEKQVPHHKTKRTRRSPGDSKRHRYKPASSPSSSESERHQRREKHRSKKTRFDRHMHMHTHDYKYYHRRNRDRH